MKRRPLTAERCLSTDAIVRQRLAGGEDAFLETLFGPFLRVPANWRDRFRTAEQQEIERLKQQREARVKADFDRARAAERAAAQRWEEDRQRAAENEARWERDRLTFPLSEYTCPRCHQVHPSPKAIPFVPPPFGIVWVVSPQPGDYTQCTRCLQVLQFQVWGMHRCEWRWVPSHMKRHFKVPLAVWAVYGTQVRK